MTPETGGFRDHLGNVVRYALDREQVCDDDWGQEIVWRCYIDPHETGDWQP